MSYSIRGLIITQSEERACSDRGWPVITLAAGVSLISLDRACLFVTEGDETPPSDDLEFNLPQWLSDIVSCFSRSAYIEAEICGGTGMQASVVLEQSTILSKPVISSGAINFALRQMGIEDGPSGTFFGLPVQSGKDPFDMVGLGRHRSVSAWLQEIAEQAAAGNSR